MAVLLLILGCAGEQPEPTDLDGDGYTIEAGDCDDDDAGVYPGAEERCDGADEDCDGRVDEDVLTLPAWYRDADEDGFGDGEPVYACTADSGWVLAAGDCDDEEPVINPAVTEVCGNELDDNCDGSSNGCMDEGIMFVDGYIDGDTWEATGRYFGATPEAGLFLGARDSVRILEGDLHGAHSAEEAVTVWMAGDETFLEISTVNVQTGAQPYLAIGQHWLSQGANMSGGVYLVPLSAPSGSIGEVAESWLEGEPASGTRHAVLLGDSEGDGRVRLAVGGEPWEGVVGAAWIVSDVPPGESSLADAEFILRGEGVDDKAGAALAGLGDVDGDGLADLAVGARNVYVGDVPGVTYVLLGPIGGRSSLADADVRLQALDLGATCGFPVEITPVEDMDQDGLPEVAIGDDTCDYVLYYTAADILAGEPSTIFRDGAGFGVSIADVGDSNGDGWRDLLVGAPDYTGCGGIAFLFRGPIWPGTYSSASSDARLYGAEGDCLGLSVAGLGDLDDDGYTEFGVYSYNSERAVSLFYGGGI